MTIILFENPNTAQAAAFMLRGKWDEFNGVTVEELDASAIKFVAEQVQSNFCCVGAVFHLQRIPEELINKYRKYTQKYGSALKVMMLE